MFNLLSVADVVASHLMQPSAPKWNWYLKLLFLPGWFIMSQALPGIAQTDNVRSLSSETMSLKQSQGDTNRLNLLLQISNKYLSKDEHPSALDSALLYAKRAENLLQTLNNSKKEGDVYLLLANIYNEKRNLVQGKAFAQKAINYFNKYGPEKKFAEAYVAVAKNYEANDTGATGIIHLAEKAIKIFDKENDRINKAGALKDIGFLLMVQGKMDSALVKLQQSLAVYNSIGYAQIQEVYSLIGASYTQLGNTQEGLNYELKAVRTAEQLNDTSHVAGTIYDYVGITYSRIQQNDKAEEYFRKALVIATRVNDTDLVILLACNIAQILSLRNEQVEARSFLQDVIKKYPHIRDNFSRLQICTRLVSLSMKLGDYKNAAIYSNRLVAVCDEFPENSPAKVTAYGLLIRYFFQTNQLDRAEQYLRQYEQISSDDHLIGDLKQVHYWGYMLDSARGNYLSALAHYKLFKTFDDSLINETKSRQIVQLQIQYETEKKDKNIQLLTDQGLLQKTQFNHMKQSRNIMIGGAVMLLLLMGLGYNRYRLKQRSNRQLEAKQQEINRKNDTLTQLLQEKEWLVKEIHHRVKNNLQIVMSLLNTQSLYLDNEAAVAAIHESQHRMHAMSLIHQKLYQAENIASVNMHFYVSELIDYLVDSIDTGREIQFMQEVDPIELDVAQAVPVGLILNEAITNAIKYAFPGDEGGTVTVIMKKTTDRKISLCISDNGIGLPENFDSVKSNSLGMSLMRGLSDQLGGAFSIKNDAGLKIEMIFPYVASINVV